MSIELPTKYGLILRKNARTASFIAGWVTQYRQRWPAYPVNEDEHLVGFALAMSYQSLVAICDDLEREGAREGVDFVKTQVEDGVIGPMPGWLQEDEDERFSVPGTGKAARSTPRPTWRQRAAANRRQLRLTAVASKRARNATSDEVAARRWPELDGGVDLEVFLDECEALVEFVEASRQGGAARTWVEAAYPDKRWHVHVPDGYANELGDLLNDYEGCAATGKQSALLRVRRRAGEYIAALELGRTTGTVDLECFTAWRSQRRH